MRLHILGIAGTFMAGLARLAHQAGHTVSGSDSNIYPPMSTQLEQMGIQFYPNDRLPHDSEGIEHYIVGNVMARGMPTIEELLDRDLPYSSGPQWLYDNILRTRQVLAVAGTHGKTTTTSMLAWILRQNGIDAGYLIGGVAEDLKTSAELGSADYFVIEADEYDTAFFDKRAKFLHYHPRVLVLNNLEHDHVDIYPHLKDIRRVFNHLLRQLPSRTQVIACRSDRNLQRVLKQGIWSELTQFNDRSQWMIAEKEGQWQILERGVVRGRLQLQADTRYNRVNALAATLAASKVGVDIGHSLRALSSFSGVKRRLQLLHKVGNTSLYEDFAHHPTAIACVIEAFVERLNRAGTGRLLLFIEMGSYSMRTGHQLNTLLRILGRADLVWLYIPGKTLYNDAQIKIGNSADSTNIQANYQIKELLDSACVALVPDDQMLLLSNRNFSGSMPEICARLIHTIDNFV